jgi:hypothetical protein
MLINSPPEVGQLAVDRQEHVVEVPRVAWASATTA